MSVAWLREFLARKTRVGVASRLTAESRVAVQVIMVDIPKRTYTWEDKYAIVSEILHGGHGRLLDVGARDRHLHTILDAPLIEYYSADLDDDHDYYVNLEEPLSLEDESFKYVVALDVLEHVENIHLAFRELMRITEDMLLIALPNVATMSQRLTYLFTGRLATGKYDLLSDHQGDRHRWLTVYPQMNSFIATNAERDGFRLEWMFEELDSGPRGVLRKARSLPGGVVISRQVLAGADGIGLLRRGRLTQRCLYLLRRQ